MSLQILKHCPTRWLSLEKVVNRVLDQLQALKSYFASHDEVERPGKVKNLHERLQDPQTKLALLFLQYVLPFLNAFNTIFQAEESKIGCIKGEMQRLLKLFLR